MTTVPFFSSIFEVLLSIWMNRFNCFYQNTRFDQQIETFISILFQNLSMLGNWGFSPKRDPIFFRSKLMIDETVSTKLF